MTKLLRSLVLAALVCVGVFVPAGSVRADTFVATAAEILYGGRIVLVDFEANTPTNFTNPDWLAGANAGKGCKLATPGGDRALRFACATLHSNVAVVEGATFTHATKYVTKAGAFVNYRPWVSGDSVPHGKTIGATVAPQRNAIAARISDDTIELVTSLGASVTATSLYEMDPGQGTKLIWRVAFKVVGAPIARGVTGITFSADAGLIQDNSSNATAAVAALAVTNNSVMATTGFVDNASFSVGSGGTGGVTLYVTPGLGSDSNTFAQAQNVATPYATLKKAVDELHTQGKAGTGSIVVVQEGTTDASSGTIQLKVDGQDADHPFQIVSGWDATAGVGTQGVRPIIPVGITTSLAGGSPNNLDFILIKGLDFFGSSTVDTALNLTLNGRVIIDDCVFRRWALGISLNCSDTSYATLMGDRYLVNRCIFYDIYSTSGHSQGIYSQYVKRCEIHDCAFDFTGRKNANGFGSDVFSRSIYHDSESEPIYNTGCYIGRSDGIQNRPGGCVLDCVFTEVHLVGYISGNGGRMARIYCELGAGFGTTEFTNCSYVHATRTLTKTGIGTTLVNNRASLYAVSGTGVTDAQHGLDTVVTDSCVLTAPGLGAGADGASDITVVAQNGPRGFGPEIVWFGDIRRCLVGCCEMFVANRLNTYGGNAATTMWGSYSATFGVNKEGVFRSFTGYGNGEQMYIQGSNAAATAPITRLHNAAIDASTQSLIHTITQSGYAWYTADNCAFKVSANGLQEFATLMTLAAYRTLTGQHANSFAPTTFTYTDNTADLTDWAANCGLAATHAALRAGMRDRELRTWRDYNDMEACVNFMLDKFEVLTINGGANAVGTGALNFYGAKSSGDTDPATFDTEVSAADGARTRRRRWMMPRVVRRKAA